MVRPCGARDFVNLGGCGLASMYPASDWSVWCSEPSWISARMRSRYRTGLERAVGVTSVRMRRKDRSSIVVSSSRRPRQEGCWLGHQSFPCLMLFLCLCLAAVPSSRPGGAAARRAQGPSKLAVAITFRLAPVFPGHALTVLSTARGSGRSGRIGLDALESAPLVKNRPGDPSELVGERDRQHVVMQALAGRRDPGLEPIALPMLRPDLDQHHPGRLYKQRAKIAIAPL